MELIILSKYKIEAVENNLTEFLSEDIVSSIEENSSILITDDTLLSTIKKEKPEYKYEYILTIRKK